MGVDSSYFQRLSLCQTIRRTIDVIAADLSVFAQLGFVTMGVYALVWASLLLILMPAFGLDAQQLKNGDPDYLLHDHHIRSFYALLFINVVVQFLTSAIGNGALVRAVAELYLHRQPSVRTCIQVGVSHSVAIIVASIVAFAAVMCGCMLFVLPGYYLMVNWFLVNPAIIVEGLGAIAALKRSWSLVADRWCYVFGTYFVSCTVMMVVQILWQSLFANAFNAFTFFGSIMGALPSLVFNPILAVMMTIMYINLRIEKEGLNAEAFSRDLGIVAPYSSLITHDEQETGENEVKVLNVV